MYPAFILSAGTLINSLLGLAFYILAARTLGIEGFGTLAYFLGLGILAAELLDWGFSQAIIKFGHHGKLGNIINLVLVQRLGVCLILLLCTWVAGGHYWLSAQTAIALLFLTVTSQAFLAQQKYLLQVGSNIFGNLVRLAGVFYLITSNHLTVPAFSWAFIWGAVISFGLGFGILLADKTIKFTSFDFLAQWKNTRRFSSWLGGSQIIASAGAKLDVPILFWLGGPVVVGLYASAQKLTSIFPQIAVALENVFSPRFSARHANFAKDTQSYKILTWLLVACLITCAAISPIAIPLIFGVKYLEAIPIFIGLTVALIPFVLSGPPITNLVYRHGRSHQHFVISLVSTLATLIGYLLFIPFYGVYGAVLSVLIANSLILVLAMGFNEN